MRVCGGFGCRQVGATFRPELALVDLGQVVCCADFFRALSAVEVGGRGASLPRPGFVDRCPAGAVMQPQRQVERDTHLQLESRNEGCRPGGSHLEQPGGGAEKEDQASQQNLVPPKPVHIE